MNFLTAGAASATPVGPIALTFKTCLPRLSLGGLNGEVQDANCPLSTLHWKVDAAWLEVNLNLGRRLVVFFGPLVIVVSGADGLGTEQ